MKAVLYMFIKLKRYCGIVFISVLVIGCQEQAKDGELDNAQERDSTKVYGSSSLILPKFIGPVQPIVDDWSIFDDFEEELVALNSVSLAELRSRTERLITFSDSLAKTLPDTLNNQPIASRILVLDTRVKLLDQAAQSQRAKDSVIHNSFLELNMALANLKQQINEKLLKDNIDLQRKENEEAELEKQRATLDSIAQAEGSN